MASGGSAALAPADIAAVKSSIDAYNRAALAADWTAFGSTLAADVVAFRQTRHR